MFNSLVGRVVRSVRPLGYTPAALRLLTSVIVGLLGTWRNKTETMKVFTAKCFCEQKKLALFILFTKRNCY